MPTFRVSAVAVTAMAGLFAGAVAPAAEPEAPADPNVVYWSSNNATLGQLSTAVGGLLVSMYNTGTLPVKEVGFTADDAGVSEVFKKASLPFGYWTGTMDSLACDLNPRVCTRPREAIGDLKGAKLTSHVGGWAITPPDKSAWTVNVGDKILVPDLPYDPVVRLLPFKVSEGVTMKATHDRYT